MVGDRIGAAVGVFDVALRLALDAASRALAQVGDVCSSDCDGGSRRFDGWLTACKVDTTLRCRLACDCYDERFGAWLALLALRRALPFVDRRLRVGLLVRFRAWWRLRFDPELSFYDAPGSHT